MFSISPRPNWFKPLNLSATFGANEMRPVLSTQNTYSSIPQIKFNTYDLKAVYTTAHLRVAARSVWISPTTVARFEKGDIQYAKLNIPEFEYRAFELGAEYEFNPAWTLFSGMEYQSAQTHVGLIVETWPFGSGLSGLLGNRYNTDFDGIGSTYGAQPGRTLQDEPETQPQPEPEIPASRF